MMVRTPITSISSLLSALFHVLLNTKYSIYCSKALMQSGIDSLVYVL